VVPSLDLMTSPAAPDAPRATARTLLPVFLAHSMVHLFLMLFPAVLFIIKRDFGQSYTSLGAVYMGATMVYGAGALPVGIVVRRVRPIVLVRLGTLAAALASLAIAAAPGAGVLAAALVLLGAAASIHHTAAFTHIAAVGRNDSRLFGYWGAWGNVGLAASPAFGGLLGWLVSWRLPFAVAGCLGLVLTVVLWLRPAGDSGLPAAAPPDGDAAGGATHMPSLAFVFGMSIAMGFVYTGFATYLPAFTGERAAFLPAADVVRGGLIASFVYCVGFFGQWWGGHAGARRHFARRYTIIVAANAFLLVAVFGTRDWPLLAMLALFSLVHFSTQPLENTAIARFTASRDLSLCYALSCVASFGIGSLASLAGGHIADAAGGDLKWIFLMLAGVAGLAALCGIGLMATERSRAGYAQLPAVTARID
jgi:FSR family fosmidomycin resistance protein-like MFS transporter